MRKFILFLSHIITIMSISAQENNYLKEPLPQKWSDSKLFEQVLPSEDKWWLRFEDPILDSLITIAGKRNLSVLDAIENIRNAKASWRIAQSNLFPTIDFGAGWQRNKTSGNIYSTGYNETFGGYFDATVSMNWQLDIFGNIHKRAKAQKELFYASEDEYRAVLVSLCANVATAYFSLRQSLAEIAVLRRNVASQKEIMDIVETRFSTGLASKLDVAQARSVYYSTLASIPSMESSIQQYRNALSILLAAYPGEIDAWLGSGTELPEYIDPIAVGIPANLLRRRPDIRSAEREVEAYASLLGASNRDWLPAFYVNGSIGFASTDIKYMPRSRSMQWNISPTITWNLFDGGKTSKENVQARAQLEQSIIRFNNTVLTAMQEVENAMQTYKSSIATIVALRETVNQNEETLRLSLELYKQGLTQFQNVLDAQRTLLNYQDNLVQAKGRSLITLIQLYEALGGGW